MLKLKIDPEFQQKIPPLTEDEYRQLEENILEAGVIYNPIVTWRGFILDGHNRYKIWQEHPEIPEPKTISVDELLADRWAVLEWICKNQLGRRNLNETQKVILVGLIYEARKSRSGAPLENKNAAKNKASVAEALSVGKTAKRLGNELEMSESQVNHAYRFLTGLRCLDNKRPGVADLVISEKRKVSRTDVEEIVKNSDSEQQQFADAIIAGEKPQSPRSMPSRLKHKEDQKSEPIKKEKPSVKEEKPAKSEDPTEEDGAAYLPDYTVQMLKDEILANFTSYLNSSGLLLEWHGNLLADKNAKNKIIELINFQIHELKKVRKEIDEKF